jgi:rhodanese-related sulfurtransferase
MSAGLSPEVPIPGQRVYFDGVNDMLAEARAGLSRVNARQAYREARRDGALLVDIRPEAQRHEHGEIHPILRPLVIERNVLEWRLDPRSVHRLEEAAFEARIIVLCQEGYTSSLAAHSLHRLGISAATDMVGGFSAWRAERLPVLAPVPR